MVIRFSVGICCLFLVSPLLAQSVNREEVLALSRRIDQLIAKKCKELDVPLAPEATASTFFRRAHLDLIGRIPNMIDALDFHDSAAEAKNIDYRWDWIERLIQSEGHTRLMAQVLRSHIFSNATSQQAQFLRPGFEDFLRSRLTLNAGYDKIVQEILSPDITVMGMRNGNNLAAFYIANENKPENLAGSASRLFLGVKIDCAQCHPHPFAKWTREQFWELAAFFSTNPNMGQQGAFIPAAAASGPAQITIPGTNKTVKAKFLDGKEPTILKDTNNRKLLADWLTSADNPWFARASADLLWQHFFGISLHDPLLEESIDESLHQAELLDEMAKALVKNGFDLKFLARAIVHTDAYRRASAVSGKIAEADPAIHNRMLVRGLSPEQLWDSWGEATYYFRGKEPEIDNRPMNPFMIANDPRSLFLNKFASQDKRTESQTSILQALFLMNGKFVSEQLRAGNNPSLNHIVQQKTETSRKLRPLFLMTLSRLPRPEEADRLIRYLDSGPHERTIPDLYWALLNSPEFMLNH